MKVDVYQKSNYSGTANASFVSRKSNSLTMHIDDASLAKWDRQIYGMIASMSEGGHELVDSAVHAILNNSMEYVPMATGTLAKSGYARTESVIAKDANDRRAVLFQGEVGFGDDAAGGVNPSNGMSPSKYAWQVHEDLTAKHPNGGQAKFLERAYREYVFDQMPGEMVALERSVYTGGKYKPKFTYVGNAKIFRGRSNAPVLSKERKTDEKSNYERLKDTYK